MRTEKAWECRGSQIPSLHPPDGALDVRAKELEQHLAKLRVSGEFRVVRRCGLAGRSIDHIVALEKGHLAVQQCPHGIGGALARHCAIGQPAEKLKEIVACVQTARELR